MAVIAGAQSMSQSQTGFQGGVPLMYNPYSLGPTASKMVPDIDSYMKNLARIMNIVRGPTTATTTTKGTTAGTQTGTVEEGIAQKTTESLSSQSFEQMLQSLLGSVSGLTTGRGAEATTGEAVTEVIGDRADIRFGEALDRIAAERAGVLERFAGAEQPLAEAKEMYAPGGTYGEGARANIEKQFQQALAASQTGLAQSGMHSGSMVEGIRTAMTGEKSRLLQGVEDTRQERLGDILQQLSGLRAGGAATMAGIQDPMFAGFVGPTGTRTVTSGAATTQTGTTSEQLTRQLSEQTGMASTQQMMENLMQSLSGKDINLQTTGTTTGTVTGPVSGGNDLSAMLQFLR